MNQLSANFSGPKMFPPAVAIERNISRAIPLGCLAPWQARRLHSYIETNLGQRLDIQRLARVVNLSTSHCCRAFKRTFGTTLHTYVMLRRVERAQHLMLHTSTDLTSIALNCGLSDQSHLTRLFRRLIGETPAAFRRARFEPPAGSCRYDAQSAHAGGSLPVR